MFSSIIHNNIKYFIIELLMTYWKKKKKKLAKTIFSTSIRNKLPIKKNFSL